MVAELVGRFRRRRRRLRGGRTCFDSGLWLGRRCRGGHGRLVRLFALRGAHAAADQHAAQEDDHDDGRGHDEQEDELLPAQLDLVEAVVAVSCESSDTSRPCSALIRFMSSIGSGKMIVEFFSEAISVSVCR